MNRELFISDSQRIFRQYGERGYHEAMADYVKIMPLHPGHALAESTVDKDKVIGLVCQHFGVSLLDLVKRDNSRPSAYKRHVLIYLLSRRTRMSHEKIAFLFERNRTTITHAIHTMSDDMETDISIRDEVEHLNGQL